MLLIEDQQKLRDWRAEHGITQAALAQRLGITAQAVRHWEAKRRPIPAMLWLALRAIEGDLRKNDDSSDM